MQTFHIGVLARMFVFLDRFKEWIKENRQKLLLLAGFLVVGALAFESGLLRGRLAQADPLVVSLPVIPEPVAVDQTQAAAEGKSVKGVEQGVSETAPEPQGECPYVGSRNSDKYHLATCAVAKRIKPENRVCFASKEEAEKRGYIASCMK